MFDTIKIDTWIVSKNFLTNIPNTFKIIENNYSVLANFKYLPSSIINLFLEEHMHQLDLKLYNLPNKIKNIQIKEILITKICFKLKNIQFIDCCSRYKKVRKYYPKIMPHPSRLDF